MNVDLNKVPTSHPAEKQALADLLTRLEHETDIPGVTQDEIEPAREEVARDMLGDAHPRRNGTLPLSRRCDAGQLARPELSQPMG